MRCGPDQPAPGPYPAHVAGASLALMSHPPGASRDFYETLAQRSLPDSTVRGIRYRNLTVAKYLGKGPGRVLEIGPGEGWLTRLLADRRWEVTALDISSGFLRGLDPGVLHGATVGSMTALPFPDGAFRGLVAAEVVEHIPDLERALAEAARVLAPGGRCVLTVPYRETLRLVRCPDCAVEFEPNGHVHRFDEASLDAHLRTAGLRPVRTFVGPTRFSREILRRAPIEPLLGLLGALDRASYRHQRVSDTWLLMAAVRD